MLIFPSLHPSWKLIHYPVQEPHTMTGPNVLMFGLVGVVRAVVLEAVFVILFIFDLCLFRKKTGLKSSFG